MSTLDHAFFYNSQDGDRVYDAESFEYWLKKFFTTGVFEGDLQVVANGNMTVTVNTGYANVDGKVRFFEDETTLSLETAGSTYDRIDTVVVERNDSDRDVSVYAITGGYGSSPQPTAPIRENGVYQLVLAQIYVSAGATSITQSAVMDTRTDTSLCGVVTGTVTEYDFDQFAAQFNSWTEEKQAEFLEWFEGVKDQLDEDAAGNLQNQINVLDEMKYVEVTVAADAWTAIYWITYDSSGEETSSASGYMATIEVENMTSSWIPGNPVLVPSETLTTAASIEADLAAQEALSCVSTITSLDGALQFVCYEDLPEADFTVRIPGLVAE